MWTILLPVVLALIVTTVLAPISIFLERRLRLPASLAAADHAAGLDRATAVIVAIGYALAPSTAGQAGAIADDAVTGLTGSRRGCATPTWSPASRSTPRSTPCRSGSSRLRFHDRLRRPDRRRRGHQRTRHPRRDADPDLPLPQGRPPLPALGTPPRRPLASAPTSPRCSAGPWATLGGFIRTQALVSADRRGLHRPRTACSSASRSRSRWPCSPSSAASCRSWAPSWSARIAVLVALVSNGWVGALIILGVVVAVQQLEGNVLSPWLQSRSMSLHAAVVLLAVALGSALFGIVGAFLAVPVDRDDRGRLALPRRAGRTGPGRPSALGRGRRAPPDEPGDTDAARDRRPVRSPADGGGAPPVGSPRPAPGGHAHRDGRGAYDRGMSVSPSARRSS